MEDQPKPKPPVRPTPHVSYEWEENHHEWVAATILIATVIVMVLVAVAAVIVYALRSGCA